MKTGLTLTQLAAEIERQNASKIDVIAPVKKLTFNDSNKLTIETVDGEYLPTEQFHSQMATHIGIGNAYSSSLRTRLPETWRNTMNDELHASKTPRLVRMLDGNARAFLSNAYERIDNSEVAQTIFETMAFSGGGKWELASADVTEKSLYIKVLTPMVKAIKVGDEVQAGFSIRNSEIGLSSFVIERWSVRLRCMNGMVGNQMLARKHVGERNLISNDDIRFLSNDTRAAMVRSLMLQTRDVLKMIVDDRQFQLYIDELSGAAERKIEGDPIAAVSVLQKVVPFTESDKKSILQHLIRGGDLTQWGLANSLTAAAQDDRISYDHAHELESAGGQVITLKPQQWVSIASAN